MGHRLNLFGSYSILILKVKIFINEDILKSNSRIICRIANVFLHIENTVQENS